MTRITVLFSALALLLIAMPAAAQYGGGGGGGGQPLGPERPPESQGQIEVTTPCETIVVSGNGWQQGEVFIERNYDSAGCPGEGTTTDVQSDLGDNASPAAFAGSAASAPVAPDGTFTATLQVPAEAARTFEVTVRGLDADGEERTETYRWDGVEAANFVPTTAEDAATSSSMVALAAVLGAVILGLAFNWPSLLRRLRR